MRNESGTDGPALQADLTEEAVLFDFLPVLLRKEVAFGFLRPPGLSRVHLAMAEPSGVIPLHADLRLLPALPGPGFIACPFDRERSKGFFIPALLDPAAVGALPDQPAGADSVFSDVSDTRREDYLRSVGLAVEAIRSGRFSKLVLSRIRSLAFQFNRVATFLETLFQAYPGAWISVFSVPGQGLWVSATPELLLSGKPGWGVQTMALAGTRPFQPGFDAGSLWSPKELEEQSLVSGFIRAVFQETGQKGLVENGPYPVQAGNLIHLRTDFHIASPAENMFFSVLDRLHPTPAVCGSPQAGAMRWIREHEGFSRSFYSGFSGWTGSGGTAMVVNLRTACFSGTRVRLFAGAGLTRNSVPEKEWEETDAKLHTLGALL
jgi:isochorismate synthase